MLDSNTSNPEILRAIMDLYRLSSKQVATILEMKEQSVRNARLDSGKGLPDVKLQFLKDLMREVAEYRDLDPQNPAAVAIPIWLRNAVGDPAEAIYVHRCPLTGAPRILRQAHAAIQAGGVGEVYDAIALLGEGHYPTFRLVPSSAWKKYASENGPLKSYGDADGLDLGTASL